MHKLFMILLIAGGLFPACPAFAYEFDFTFTTSSGQLVVVDYKNKVGKSAISVETLSKLIDGNIRLIKENKTQAQKIDQLQARLSKIEERIKTLERKK